MFQTKHTQINRSIHVVDTRILKLLCTW